MTVDGLDCPKQARCSGCALGGGSYPVSLAQKAAALSTALSPYSDLTPRVLPARAASPTHAYRLRAKLVCQGRSLGLFERGSHRVLDIAGCRVLSAALTRASVALRARLPLPIHGADLRETSEGVLITLLSEQPHARDALLQLARELVGDGVALSVAVALRRPGEVKLLASEPEVVCGPAAARHALSEGAPYAYAAHGGFVQAHAGQASFVYSEITRGLESRFGSLKGRSVLELFAGNGSLALQLARAGAQVTAVEAYAPAIELARRAAREQGLDLEAHAEDAAHFALATRQRFDAILVNPPRRGLEPALRDAVAAAAPRALTYLSCNPRTLSRDAAHLHRLGLRLEQAEPLDMIPWSDAVEALTWFTPAPLPAPPVLFRDEACIAVDKGAHQALEDAGRPGRTLTALVRSLPGFDAAVALEAWGAGVSGVCWFARDPEHAARLRPALSEAERQCTLLVRGNLRKQGTITRRAGGGAVAGARYSKLADVKHHSLALARINDPSELAMLRDFASIRHPVLGDPQSGDPASNRFAWHRHGLDRPFVHVGSSSFTDAQGARRSAKCELPPDLSWVVESLGSDQAALERR